MNEAIAFDTHRYVKRLTENGFSEQQAEVLAEEQVAFLNANLATKIDIAEIHAKLDTINADIENLRTETKSGIENLRAETKSEIEKLRAETKSEIEKLRAETKSEIEKCKSDLIKWVVGAIIAQGGLIVALVSVFSIPAT